MEHLFAIAYSEQWTGQSNIKIYYLHCINENHDELSFHLRISSNVWCTQKLSNGVITIPRTFLIFKITFSLYGEVFVSLKISKRPKCDGVHFDFCRRNILRKSTFFLLPFSWTGCLPYKHNARCIF